MLHQSLKSWAKPSRQQNRGTVDPVMGRPSACVVTRILSRGPCPIWDDPPLPYGRPGDTAFPLAEAWWSRTVLSNRGFPPREGLPRQGLVPPLICPYPELGHLSLPPHTWQTWSEGPWLVSRSNYLQTGTSWEGHVTPAACLGESHGSGRGRCGWACTCHCLDAEGVAPHLNNPSLE